MAHQGHEDETPMLGRSVTFTRSHAANPRPPPGQYQPATSFLSKVLGTKVAATGRVSESLDYEPIQNKLFYDRMKSRKEGKKKLYGYTGHTLAKMLVTVSTGIITGLFAVFLSKFTGAITEWKLGVIEDKSWFVSFLLFWLIGSVLVSAATALVRGLGEFLFGPAANPPTTVPHPPPAWQPLGHTAPAFSW